MNEKQLKRGGASGGMIWVAGSIITLLMGWNVYSSQTNVRQDDILVRHGERITSTEIRLERLPIIEAKLDALLEKQRISPASVERNLQDKHLATSSQARI